MTAFGWEGLALKVALVSDGCLAVKSVAVAAHHIFALRYGDTFRTRPEFTYAFVVLMGVMIACGYLVMADKPTRWLLSTPRMKSALYVVATLPLALYGVQRGWL